MVGGDDSGRISSGVRLRSHMVTTKLLYSLGTASPRSACEEISETHHLRLRSSTSINMLV